MAWEARTPELTKTEADIERRRERGEAWRFIARCYGVSHETIRTHWKRAQAKRSLGLDMINADKPEA